MERKKIDITLLIFCSICFCFVILQNYWLVYYSFFDNSLDEIHKFSTLNQKGSKDKKYIQKYEKEELEIYSKWDQKRKSNAIKLHGFGGVFALFNALILFIWLLKRKRQKLKKKKSLLLISIALVFFILFLFELFLINSISKNKPILPGLITYSPVPKIENEKTQYYKDLYRSKHERLNQRIKYFLFEDKLEFHFLITFLAFITFLVFFSWAIDSRINGQENGHFQV